MRFAQAFVLLVLGLASLEQAVAKCNPKKDESCCGTPFPSSPYPPVPALPAAVAAPPAEVLPPTPLGACAEDTGKCKMLYPERCASKSFVKKCRKSCHEEYPLMKYCKPDKFAELEAKFEALKLTPGPKGEKGEKDDL